MALAVAGVVAASGAAASPASLARAYRESPTAARRAALERYAQAHARQTSGALARLALGIAAFEQKDWKGAIDSLAGLEKRLPALADYPAYYAAAARLEAGEAALDPQSLAPVRATAAPSPLAARAAVVQARMLVATGAPDRAIPLLRESYPLLPQPEGDLALAAAYDGSGDAAHAALYYQQVYHQYPLADGAVKAATAMEALRDAMGANYPQPTPILLLTRADKLREGRDYSRARIEYRALADRTSGAERDLAQVRAAACDYLTGDTAQARRQLQGLSPSHPEADAERLYYIVQCARRMGTDSEMLDAIQRLAASHPRSPWRLKALISAGNRYLLVNDAKNYLPLYTAAFEGFPADPQAPYAHWKVAWHAYISRKPDAAEHMRRHLSMFSLHPSAGGALYFLGRLAEERRQWGDARACYTRLAERFPHYYYGVLARERLADARVAGAKPGAAMTAFLESVAFSEQPAGDGEQPTAATRARLERVRLLQTAGLDDLAAAEVRFGGDGEQSTLLAVELARSGAPPHRKLRYLKGVRGDYLSLPLDRAPEAYWRGLFPLPYRAELERAARRQKLDPLVLAGLIRQESEFNPRAVSSARAYGLTQVLPSTGRQLARRLGIRRFTTSMLYQPEVNLRLGTFYMRLQLDRWNGELEKTLAAYNAGPRRVAEWSTWYEFREPAEFVETVPFTQTREYIQAVVRNAAVYRLVYAGKS